MGGFDNATWQALGLVLTVLGLGISLLVWSRRGAASGLRGVAWSLLPLAAGLTGVLRLGWEVADAVADWAVRLVFSPMVWLGLVVAMVSVVLFVVSGFLARRGGRGAAVRGGKPTGRAALPRRQSGTAAHPPTTGATPGGGSSADSTGAGDDMADIEEILRKHGIT